MKCAAKTTNEFFLEEYRKESDRACVILSGAMLDEILKAIIKSKLVSVGDKKADPLFDGANSPLSTFSSKIEIAYRLGLISENLRRDLHIIRKIRNEFAHEIFDCNFNNKRVQDLINELVKSTGIIERHQNVRDKFDDGVRGNFQMIMSQIVFYLWSGAFQVKIEPIKESSNEWIYGKSKK